MMKIHAKPSLFICFHQRTRFDIHKWSNQDDQAIFIRLIPNITPTARKTSLRIRFGDKSAERIASESTDKRTKKGTIVGAVALIIGTSIGTGILAVPKRTSPAGFFPSAVTMTVCWAFLLLDAILLSEVNVDLLKRKKQQMRGREGEEELEVISIRTMAQATLGEWGGALATLNYVFLGYTTVLAYTAKSGEILSNLTGMPPSISGVFFTAIFTILISVGSTRTTDQVNQWLTAAMIGLLVAIDVLAVVSGEWSGLEEMWNWEEVPPTIPVIIFTLVYHDLAPVICAYLDGDIARIRTSFAIGSLTPLLILLVWNAVALGLSAHADNSVDPVDMLMRLRWTGASALVQTFSLLAVGTSLIGTLLGFSKFFLEQLDNLAQRQSAGKRSPLISFAAAAMAVVPSLFISTIVPDAFSAATDIAGGYCMTFLYGVFPSAMALAMQSRRSTDASLADGYEDEKKEDVGQLILSEVRPVPIVLGLFGCGIIMEQILQEVSALHPY
ncbi:hypothetical protein Sjap_000937 [Stephania japonica]|uniref:Tryptophan/tyrosine permease n=1 Tax=Stephania japonica TaxID=461633 RepID=A0AAP0PR78_9MAGN